MCHAPSRRRPPPLPTMTDGSDAEQQAAETRPSPARFGLRARLSMRVGSRGWLPETAPAIADLDLAAGLAFLVCEPVRQLIVEPPEDGAALGVADIPAVAGLRLSADHIGVHVCRPL